MGGSRGDSRHSGRSGQTKADLAAKRRREARENREEAAHGAPRALQPPQPGCTAQSGRATPWKGSGRGLHRRPWRTISVRTHCSSHTVQKFKQDLF